MGFDEHPVPVSLTTAAQVTGVPMHALLRRRPTLQDLQHSDDYWTCFHVLPRRMDAMDGLVISYFRASAAIVHLPVA